LHLTVRIAHGGALSGLGDVLSIGKLATGQADYYLEQARGRVDAVYTPHDQPPEPKQKPGPGWDWL
jgi:hypothetical protein